MTPTQTAETIITEARQWGFQVEVDNDLGILTVGITFGVNDTVAYYLAEADANALLRMIRMVRPGTVWGTDSASVGGHAGLTGGYMRLSKSGVDKRVLRAIRKIQTAGVA